MPRKIRQLKADLREAGAYIGCNSSQKQNGGLDHEYVPSQIETFNDY